MYRIDDASAATSLPVPETAGTEGYWTEGNPATGVPATLERASWFNMVQEELRAIVVAGALTPSKTVYSQVLNAIRALIGSPVRVVQRQAFTASGTYFPSAGMVYVEVEAIGGGGGSGGALGSAAPGAAAGGAGGAGGYTKRIYTAAQIGASCVVVVGAAGVGGAAGNNAGSGGGATGFVPGNATTLNLISGSGTGGAGGPASNVITTGGFPGSGGTATGGDINVPGDNAGVSLVMGGSSVAIGASGASSRYGAGGLIGGIAANSNPGTGYGSGASGGAASTTSRAGANGAPGICIITEYCNQ